MTSDLLEQIDRVARRFHELYYDRIYTHVISMSGPPDYDLMDEHAEALRSALFQMQEEGTITVNEE